MGLGGLCPFPSMDNDEDSSLKHCNKFILHLTATLSAQIHSRNHATKAFFNGKGGTLSRIPTPCTELQATCQQVAKKLRKKLVEPMKDGGTREEQFLCAHCKQDTIGLGLLKIPTYVSKYITLLHGPRFIHHQRWRRYLYYIFGLAKDWPRLDKKIGKPKRPSIFDVRNLD
jgi:hypothetical protein